MENKTVTKEQMEEVFRYYSKTTLRYMYTQKYEKYIEPRISALSKWRGARAIIKQLGLYEDWKKYWQKYYEENKWKLEEPNIYI